jgi:excisionase family DNA binding protein
MKHTASQQSQQSFTLDEAAEALRCSTWTLRAHLRLGNIESTRIGRLIRISSGEIDRIQRDGLPSLSAPREQMVPNVSPQI